MKKYFTLLGFIAVFFIGLQQTQAQDSRQQSPEQVAKMQTHAIHQAATLTGDQQAETFYILVDYHQNLKGLRGNTSIEDVKKVKASLVESTNAKLKAVLNAEQYAAHLELLNEYSK
ncbi:hypothetical protein [Oceanihabitans sediminis]|uniref:hypothetical protein n=1 Tax=Oceanihabitans sediminis TaxID=1812012 RepID=UPI00299E9BF0|nr:hypothetical protein [Oceanihabitans sediminis]MDX1278967.1 hypothetical protein [Oceanihabitans sediminis]MDX1772491.1 hypothetical protein [Oceanihabitans sediminis]